MRGAAVRTPQPGGRQSFRPPAAEDGAGNRVGGAYSGLRGLVSLVNSSHQSQSGDGLMNRNVFAFFGLAAGITAVLVITVSTPTPGARGIDTLKCYAGVIEKPCDRSPPVVRTSDARSD